MHRDRESGAGSEETGCNKMERDETGSKETGNEGTRNTILKMRRHEADRKTIGRIKAQRDRYTVERSQDAKTGP